MTPEGHGKPIAVVVGAHPFPHGNASANRMLGLALALKATGRDAVVLNDDPRLEVHGEPVTDSVSGVKYTNLGGKTDTRLHRWSRRRTFGQRIAQLLASGVDVGRVDSIVIPSFFYTWRTRRALAHCVPNATLIVDVVERHDPSQFRLRWFAPYFIRHRLTSWYATLGQARIIVISTSLARGPFRRHRPHVVPPIVDPDEFTAVAQEPRPLEGPVTITYFGSPGAKDDLSGIVAAASLLSDTERAKCAIVIAGITREQLAALPGVSNASLTKAGRVVEARGSLDRSELRALLASSHFTYLMRDPDAGFARYGFPTKIAESLAAGCPPITNITSDLGSYLRDGVNALVCADQTDEAIAASLRRAIAAVEADDQVRMATAARELAEASFSPLALGRDLGRWLAT